MIGYYYRRGRGDDAFAVFESTPDTRSNWDPNIQHGSPPLALMTKLVEDATAGSGQRIGRLAMDILGPVPVAPLWARTWVERPGTRIALHAAELLAQRPDGGRRPVARLHAWLLATSDTADVAGDRHPPLTEGAAVPVDHGWLGAPGYLETVDWRAQRSEPGADAVSWLTPRSAVVEGEEPTPLQRLAAVVDSANGIGAVLDPRRFVFMNTDTVVHLHRLPRGTDFAVRARASIGPDGIGVTTAEVYDRDGCVGSSAQTLLVQRMG